MAARKKSTGKQMMSAADMKKQMQADAEAMGNREKDTQGNKISLKGNKFSLGGDTLGREMDVVILNYSHLRTYYDRRYDGDEPVAPACFHLSLDGEDMAPHENSAKPQCETCNECEWDAWGSAEVGEGKRCKEKRRLLLLSHEDDLANAQTAILEIPSTSLKNWRGYLKKLQKQAHLPPYGVVTRLSLDEDSEYAFVEFEVVEQLTDEELAAVFTHRETSEEEVLVPYDPDSYEEPSNKKPSRKKTVKKKAARRSTTKKKAAPKKKSTRGGSKFGR